MNKKKIIFGIALFVAIGLFLFTFANPKNDDDNQNNDIVKPTTNEVKPEVTPAVEPTEVVEPATTTVLEAPRNNQVNNFANVVTPTQNNIPRVEPQQPTVEPTTDPVVEPTPVYYNVKYLGFNNEILMNKDVLAGSTVEAPEANDVTLNNVVYTFAGWDNEVEVINENTVVHAIYEITKITATIVLDGEEYGTIGLKVDESLFDAISNPAVVTEDQEVIEGLVDGTLPTTEVLNHKYAYTSLEFVEEVGFVITGNLVIDEEALARNTVVLTYVIDDNAKFANGTKSMITKTTNGYNAVELPKVYVGRNEVHVNWKDANGELKEGYTSSMTLTAKIDREGPVITLNGLTDRTVFITNGSYQEEGFTVTDNYTTFTANDVNISIKLGNKTVSKVDYSKEGTYTITYTATDTEGNVGTAKRVITVKKVELTGIELSKTTGTYFVDEDMENITVTAVYNNGDRKVLNRKSCRYGNYYCTDGYTQDKEFDSHTTGNKSITYTYNGKSATYTYEVKKIEVVSLELSKTSGVYYVGDSMENITVTAIYNNGDRKVLSKQFCRYGNYYCTDGYTQNRDFDSRTTGNKSITYTYSGKTATYTYEVKETVVTGIELSSYYGSYIVGDDMEHLDVYVVYSNGRKEKVDHYSVQGFNTNKNNVGNGHVITVNYKGMKANYTYDVKYHAEIGKEQFFFTVTERYLDFDIPNYTTVANITFYDANGVAHNITVNGRTRITISKEEYDMIHAMDGNNANQKLVVTYNVKGEEVVSTYTKVVAD